MALHCTLFAIQYTCARSWLDSGLKVDRLIGHSFGQLTALCVAGSLSLFDALRLVLERARLIETHCSSQNGLMLAVEGSRIDLDRLLSLAEQHCKHYSADIACYNGPRSFVIAGDEVSIQAIEKASEEFADLFHMKRLENSHAYHSRLLDGIIPDLLQMARELRFAAPTMSIEACSDDDWSNVTADKIARHTRRPVRFMDAVRNIEQQVNNPVVWLEAGSGSPIMPMIKRAVDSSHEHVYISTHLRNSDAQINFSKATCRLWSSGVRAQFWPFHGSQRSSYTWINLPPYQFAKTSHWLDYKPTTPAWEIPTFASKSPQSELLRLLPELSRQGETLFQINPKHELYQLGTKGHEVVEQTLCPASMYNEFVVTASRLLSDTATPFIPQLSGLTISSPLVLDPLGDVLLRLVEQKSQMGSWDFTLFTRNKQNGHTDPITHATGRVTVYKSGTLSTTITNFQSLKGLILQRCNEIEGSSKSIGFKRPTVYRAMRLVVTYLDYYHGIQSIYSMGNEAVARVALPASRPLNMGAGFCDPVLIDSFTQVSGVCANCFARDEDNEMWVCNFIGEISFAPRFVETARKEQTWITYSKYEKPTPKKLQCNIFVFEPESGELVLTIMEISFLKLSIKSLTKTLGRLDSLNKTPVKDAPAKGVTGHIETDFSASSTPHAAITPQPIQPEPFSESIHTVVAHPPAQKVLPSQTVDTTDIKSESLQKVKQMLSDIIEIPVEEIMPDSALKSLGVDSLLVTEIFAEVNQRFPISLSQSDVTTITDVQGLAQLVSGSSLPPASTSALVPTSTSTPLPTAQSAGSWTQIDMETVLYGERGDNPLSADIYYPNCLGDTQRPLPIGESIHFALGEVEGGH